jgi:GNAT superfamily N-acetyltransferase
MLSRLKEHRYAEIKDAHRELILSYPLINGVMSGVQTGFVYADDSGRSIFICTKSGFSLFSTSETDASINRNFFAFLKDNRDIPKYLHLYDPPRPFREFLEANWDQFKVRERVQFRNFRQDKTYHFRDLLPAGFQTNKMQEVPFEDLERCFNLDFGRRYWDSREEFLSKAIGACILDKHHQPAAICYSACVVEGIAEMDTLVLPEYRGRGFMRIVSEPFFNLAIERGVVPHWDTFISNSASYIMAQKFELKRIRDYDLLSLFLG